MKRSTVLSRARAAAAFATAAALVVGLAACGDDGDGGDDEDDQSSGPPTTAAPTSTTQPSATEDEEAAFEAVREVFDEREGLINELYQDPSLIEDPDGHHVEELRRLGTNNTQQAVDDLLSELRELAADGHRLQAAGDIMSDRGIYRLATVDANTITFEVCILGDNVRVDQAGEVVPNSNTVFGTFGGGEARRVDGAWRIHEMIRDTDNDLNEQDRSPGTLYDGACDREFGEGEEEAE